jgi:glycerophosphoryl diester phosphodiesterase
MEIPLTSRSDGSGMIRTPEIIAHRGVPREAPENTLRSFAMALAQGADAIELDVHATRDGVVVVHHDPTVTVESATGPVVHPIAAVAATELLTLPLVRGGTVPTLDAVLELVGGRARVYVEVKATGIEQPLLACLARHPEVATAVHAFDHRIPSAIRQADAGRSIGWLSVSYPVDLSASLGATPPEALWQHAELIDEALVAAAHARGVRVIAWTVNDLAQCRALVAMGVDGLCTDVPALLKTLRVP